MAVNLSPIWGAGAQLLDNSGNVLSGGKIYTYAAGTTTPATTYTSSSGITANSNPIILNSAGRVPYEIWLTDGVSYKFVLKDSNDVLIATYDNLVGINSNFIAYTAQQEIQTATAGQTVFNLTTMQYQPGTNNLSVFVDGVNQYGPGASYAYVETDSDTVTFVSGLHVGASVKFTTATPVSSSATNAENVSYTPPDGVTTNVAAQLDIYNNAARYDTDFIAVGNNAVSSGDGLQIGGGNTDYGSNGNIFSPDGHYSWTRFQPSANESSIELNLYPSASQGIATATVGTNELTRVSGTDFTSDWIGKKIYFGESVYKVSNVSDADHLTVTTVGGGAVSFASTYNETYHVVYVSGSGICNVSGNTVTRVSGDPFVPFYTASSFVFNINGTDRTVTGFTSGDIYTISASLSLTDVPYTFSFDVNDQISTFRLQKLIGGNEENLSIYSRYDGYWIHSLYAGSGQYRKITIGAGERTPGDLSRQLTLQKNGDLSICGDYNYETIRVLNQSGSTVNRLQTQGAPTGFSPYWASRGSDTNVGFGIDTQGTGTVSFTSNSFGQTNLQVFGSGSSGAWLTITSSSTAPTLSAGGAASDIDINLAPKGTNGRLIIGTRVASGDAPITGYIEVKDNAGNIRKLAIIG